MNQPIFLLSSERSGSNLLRVMMDSHHQICAPHAPHLVKTFVPIIHKYGPLTCDGAFRQLVSDAHQVISVQLRGWPYLPSVDEVVAATESPSLAAAIGGMYDRAARNAGKIRLFIKDNGNIPYASWVALMYPDAQFVYLVRDARDAALSWKHSPGHPGGVTSAAKMWRDEQTAALRFLSLIEKSRLTLIHYEDLVTAPESELRQVCARIGVEYDSAMLQFYEGSEARTSADTGIGWKNLVQPVLSDNHGKYRSDLSRREQRLVEKIAGQSLLQLGYALDHRPATGDSWRDTWGKVYRAGLTTAYQLLRGPAGTRELKGRAKRLVGLRQIETRALRQSPEWHRAKSLGGIATDES